MDFRSDTVTKTYSNPCAMQWLVLKSAMMFYGDPTVNELETGRKNTALKRHCLPLQERKQNLLGLMSHCDRGDGIYAVNKRITINLVGAAVLGSIQPQPIENNPDGTIDFAKLKAAIKTRTTFISPALAY